MPTKYIIPPWTKHTDWHWSKWIEHEGEDHQIHYWPTKRKFRWKGVTHVGDVETFIKEITEPSLLDGPRMDHPTGHGKPKVKGRRYHDPI